MNWLQRLCFGRQLSNQRSLRVKPSPRFHNCGQLERLEDRRLLAAYIVNTLNDVVAEDGSLSLREAIQAANINAIVNADTVAGESDSDTITFASSIAGGTITLSQLGELVIADDVTIDGADSDLSNGDAGPVIISGNVLSRVFSINTAGAPGARTVAIQNLVITAGAADNGAGLRIVDTGDVVSLSEVRMTLNTATNSGGAIHNAGTLTLTGGTLSSNTAGGAAEGAGGGGIFNDGGSLGINGTTIEFNEANGALGSGGGVFSLAGSVSIADSTIRTNSASRAGGGLEVVVGTVTVTNTSFISNDVAGLGEVPATPNPGNGGGVHLTGAASVSISGGTFFNNVAAAEGGGLWNSSSGTLQITGTVIDANTASGAAADQGGGGVFNAGGTVTISGATISNNIADGTNGSGGGILNDASGSVSLTNTIVSDNRANRAGGGIEGAAGTTTTLLNSDLTGNSVGISPAVAAPGNGGGLHLTGNANLMMTGGTVADNIAALEGGGLWNAAGSMTVTGTTITRNFARGNAADDGGGGVFNNAGTLSLTSTIIDHNEASGILGSGGGVLSLAGTVTTMDSNLRFNSANRAGGGLEVVVGTVNLLQTNFISNDAAGLGTEAVAPNPGNGGGVHVTGAAAVTINGGTYFNNQAAAEGGALWNSSTGTMSVTDSEIDGNIASGVYADQGGGGLFNAGGVLTIEGATITNNIADGTFGSGGGVFNDRGTVTITGATITGNSANGTGGGVGSLPDSASVTITSSTITDNTTIGRTTPLAVSSTTGPNGESDPPNLPSGPQPTSFAQQRSALREIRISLPAPITAVTAADVVLSNLGVNVIVDPDVVITLRNDQVSFDAISGQLEISLDASQATDGVYELRLLQAVTGGAPFTVSGNSILQLTQLTGDFNGDGGVNVLDFATLVYWFTQNTPTAPSYVDLDGTGFVNIQDFSRFVSRFGQSLTSAGGEGEGELLVDEDNDGHFTAFDTLLPINRNYRLLEEQFSILAGRMTSSNDEMNAANESELAIDSEKSVSSVRIATQPVDEALSETVDFIDPPSDQNRSAKEAELDDELESTIELLVS